MKPFRFSLEFLLVMRQQKEQAAQQRYVAALAASNDAERLLQRAVADLDAGWKQLSDEVAAGVAAGRLAAIRTWCKVLEIRWNERRAGLDQARQVVDQAFAELTSAAREREALDRFHDKSRSAYDREAQRVEQRTLDELAVQMKTTPGPFQYSGGKN